MMDARKIHGPTRAGQLRAIAKGIFLTSEPLVEHAEYMLARRGLSREEKVKYYTRFARTDTTDRIFEKMLEARDQDFRDILARGFKRSFERALEKHDSETTSQYSAAAMLGHFREKREYVLKVLGQADEVLRKSFMCSEETVGIFADIKGRIEKMKGERWMEPDPWGF
ncbi:MAG: hypothetical protein AB1324_08540 [Candidatus Micrarchaeota archaeon]